VVGHKVSVLVQISRLIEHFIDDIGYSGVFLGNFLEEVHSLVGEQVKSLPVDYYVDACIDSCLNHSVYFFSFPHQDSANTHRYLQPLEHG